MRTGVAALVAVVAVGALGACSGDDGERPTTDELAAALAEPGNPVGAVYESAGAGAEVLDCIAEVFHDSDLSDGFLRSVVTGEDGYESDGEDDAVLVDLTGELSDCLTG